MSGEVGPVQVYPYVEPKGQRAARKMNADAERARLRHERRLDELARAEAPAAVSGDDMPGGDPECPIDEAMRLKARMVKQYGPGWIP